MKFAAETIPVLTEFRTQIQGPVQYCRNLLDWEIINSAPILCGFDAFDKIELGRASLFPLSFSI